MPESAHPSRSVEDFLKAVYALQPDGGRVSTNRLSERLAISAPSVTDMAQRMVAAGLVDYQKYHGVRLTPAGEQIAVRVVRRHRLIELFLVRELGYDLTQVHDEAEALEHAVSERFVEALAAKLDDPQEDPHGDPIPAADGTIQHREQLALTELPVGVTAVVSQFDTANADMLQHMLDRGFALRSRVKVIASDPFDGPLTAEVDGRRAVIGRQVAAAIFVQPETDQP